MTGSHRSNITGVSATIGSMMFYKIYRQRRAVMNEQLKPNPDLKPLDRLIGTWKQSGELDGEIRYEWAEGGFFLIQHVDFIHGESKIKGMEIIGHESLFGAEPGEDIKSRFYSFLD